MSVEPKAIRSPMEIFSATPKLLEKILPYLDLVSNVSLVKARDVTQAILEKSLY